MANAIATPSEMKAEAVKRMEYLGINPEIIELFKEYGELFTTHSVPLDLSFTLDDDLLGIIEEREKSSGCLIYHVIEGTYLLGGTDIMTMDSCLIVTKNKDDWEMDWNDLKNGIVYAYVYNKTDPILSENGLIGVRSKDGGLIRDDNNPQQYEDTKTEMTLRDFLNYFEFDYHLEVLSEDSEYFSKGDKVIKLDDLQHANLGNIESEEFEYSQFGVNDIVSRLTSYEEDYVINGLQETLLKEHNIDTSDMTWEEIYHKLIELNLDYDMDILPYIVGKKELVFEENTPAEKNKDELERE